MFSTDRQSEVQPSPEDSTSKQISNPTTFNTTTTPSRKISLFSKQPESKRVLTRPELLLLWKSAKLPPHSFPPWTDPPEDSEFTLPLDQKLFR